MKYIRTKTKIKAFDDYLIDKGIHRVLVGSDIGYEEIIKSTDTIEELCDEFVIIHTEYDNSKDIFKNQNCFLSHRGDSYYSFNLGQIKVGGIEIEGTLYGAIWTDKGLIYVAKMNEKGELELL